MIEYQLWFPKKAKRNTHQRRRRREREGELVQMDASDHEWFEDRGPRCHLHLLVDDATSKIYGGYFTEEETTEGYFQACFSYFEERGLPISFYNDKRGTFKVNNGKKRGDTQFGRAMKELGIGMIYAHSPEAKGRIERAFGVLQERLVWEMRIENISNIEEANLYLPKFFKMYNKKFSKEPANPSNAHREFNQKQQLKYILCRKESRTVSKNLEIQYENVSYQLFGSKEQHVKLIRNKIDVLVTLDGEMRLEHKGQEVKFKRFEEIPYQRKFEECQYPEIKEKNTRTKKTPITNFHMAVTKRGYIEREEIMSSKEKAAATLRLVRRKEDARKENLEILSELKDGTIG
jgi:hypothetical protein